MSLCPGCLKTLVVGMIEASESVRLKRRRPVDAAFLDVESQAADLLNRLGGDVRFLGKARTAVVNFAQANHVRRDVLGHVLFRDAPAALEPLLEAGPLDFLFLDA